MNVSRVIGTAWLYSHQFRTQCDLYRMGLHEYREGTDYVAQRVQCGPNFPAPINVTSQCRRIDPSKALTLCQISHHLSDRCAHISCHL